MSEHALQWLIEEKAVLDFLDDLKPKLPIISDCCDGPYFSLLKLVYGYEEGALAGGGVHYSERLTQCLAELNANLSTDSVYWPEEFVS